jgi:hypothetical protein
MTTDTEPEPLLVDPAYEVAAVEQPTQADVDAGQDAPHGDNPELTAEGDER